MTHLQRVTRNMLAAQAIAALISITTGAVIALVIVIRAI
jgi:hypothetical protein